MSAQLSMFSPNPAPAYTGQVYQRAAGWWVAEIEGGWWMGTGRTRQAAIDAATRALENELSRWHTPRWSET